MGIHREESFDDLDPAQVRRRLLDAATWARYAELTQALSHDFTVTDQGTRFVRVMSTEGLPGPVRTVLGEQMDITEELNWADDSRATLRAEVDRVDAKVAGELRLVPTGAGTLLSVNAPGASLPWRFKLFGAQVDAMVASAIGKLSQAVRG